MIPNPVTNVICIDNGSNPFRSVRFHSAAVRDTRLLSLQSAVLQTFEYTFTHSMVSVSLVVITAILGIPILLILYHSLFRKTKFQVVHHYTPEPASDLYDGSKPKGTYFTSDPTECVDIQFTRKGVGSESESPPMTVMELITKSISKLEDSVYLSKEYKDSDGVYR